MQREINKLEAQYLIESAIEAAWIQWGSLGSFLESDRSAISMVDPEALLLVSLVLRQQEKRLWNVAASWARNGSRLFSVQRIKNLLEAFPEDTKSKMAEFASLAKTEGGDFRWRSLAGSEASPIPRGQLLGDSYPEIWDTSALLLRLRLAFGMGIVPDLLGFLLSLRGEWASARLIARATNFSVYSIRRTADNMAVSRLIESTEEKPVEYRIKTREWCDLLNIDGELPAWRYWYQVYSFIADVIGVAATRETSDQSPYLLATILRDIAEKHEDVFTLNRIEIPDPKRFPGEEYIDAFHKMILTLSSWIRDSV
jgi:hypothetical protein